jgi:hypothetical protein
MPSRSSYCSRRGNGPLPHTIPDRVGGWLCSAPRCDASLFSDVIHRHGQQHSSTSHELRGGTTLPTHRCQPPTRATTAKLLIVLFSSLPLSSSWNSRTTTRTRTRTREEGAISRDDDWRFKVVMSPPKHDHHHSHNQSQPKWLIVSLR